jgi:hypothetical protein
MQENHPNYKFLSNSGKNEKFMVSTIHSVTIEDLNHQREDIKADTDIKFYEKINKKTQSNEQRNKKMLTFFSSSDFVVKENPVDNNDSSDYEYDEEAIDRTIVELTSESIDEEYINSPMFGELSEFESLDLEQNKEVSINNEHETAVSSIPIISDDNEENEEQLFYGTDILQESEEISPLDIESLEMITSEIFDDFGFV